MLALLGDMALATISPSDSGVSFAWVAPASQKWIETILSILRRNGGVSALARQLGETQGATAAAVDAALPGLLEDFLQFDGGLEALLAVIDEAGGGAMAQAIMVQDRVDIAPGLQILSRIRPAATADPSSQGQVIPELHQRIEPLLAMLMGGYISVRAATDEPDMAEIAALLDARKAFYSPGDEQI